MKDSIDSSKHPIQARYMLPFLSITVLVAIIVCLGVSQGLSFIAALIAVYKI